MPSIGGTRNAWTRHNGTRSTTCCQATLSVRSTTAFRLTIGARTAHPASESRSGSLGSHRSPPVPTDPGPGEEVGVIYGIYRNSWSICCWFWFPSFAVAAQAGASGGVVPELIR